MQAPALPLIVFWDNLTPYAAGMAEMEALVADVMAGGPPRVVFCEHEPVLTVGSSGSADEVRPDAGVPVVSTGRGGKVTFHGPGQRVVYVIAPLDLWGRDVRAYVRWLQDWVVASVAKLGVAAHLTDDIGVWVTTPAGTAKLAAVGVRVRRGVVFHGLSLNVSNDLGIYARFVPCGITDKGVASLRALGWRGSMADVDAALQATLVERWTNEMAR